MENLPYVQTIGTLESMLDKIKTASVPEKFSQDFVSTKLSLKGGSARAIIPFVKKMGLVSSDGTPTDRYKEFRNPDKSGFAIADAMRELYELLFGMNEYVYDLDTAKLKGLIVEATGAEANSTLVQKTLSTFQALKKRADFEGDKTIMDDAPSDYTENSKSSFSIIPPHAGTPSADGNKGINLSYSINLNLPATTDIEIFNAIFKSLKQHLIQE
jgi:hypothetical protein